MTQPSITNLVAVQRAQAAKTSHTILVWGLVGSALLHGVGLIGWGWRLTRSPALDTDRDPQETITEVITEAVTVETSMETTAQDRSAKTDANIPHPVSPAVENIGFLAANSSGDAADATPSVTPPTPISTHLSPSPQLAAPEQSAINPEDMPKNPVATALLNPETDPAQSSRAITATARSVPVEPSPTIHPSAANGSTPASTPSSLHQWQLPQRPFPKWSSLLRPRHSPSQGSALTSMPPDRQNLGAGHSDSMVPRKNAGSGSLGEATSPNAGPSVGTIGARTGSPSAVRKEAPSSGSDRPAAQPSNTHRPQCRFCPEPQNVRDAQGRPIEGTARVIYDVDQNGRVINLRLRQSSGNAAIDQATLDAISQWQFEASATGRRGVQNRVNFVETGSDFHRQVEQQRRIEQQQQQAERVEQQRPSVKPMTEKATPLFSPPPSSPSPVTPPPASPLPTTPSSPVHSLPPIAEPVAPLETSPEPPSVLEAPPRIEPPIPLEAPTRIEPPPSLDPLPSEPVASPNQETSNPPALP